MNIINNIGFLLIVTAGVAFAINGRFSVTTVFLFIQFSKQFTRPLNEIANQYTSILNAMTGAERVFEIMDEPSEIDEGKIVLKPQRKSRAD